MRLTRGPNAIFEVTSVAEAMMVAARGAGAVVVSVRNDRTVRRMADPSVILEIKQRVVNIPVMVKVRVGHLLEARLAEAMRVDYIDEDELLAKADPQNFFDKTGFNDHDDDEKKVRFVGGCNDFYSMLRRVHCGANLIRIQGDVYSRGDFAETVCNVRKVMSFGHVLELDKDDVQAYAENIHISASVLFRMRRKGGLPVAAFASGGIFSPADAALMMQMGCTGVIVGFDIFRYPNADRRVQAIVNAVKHPQHYQFLAFLSRGLEPNAHPPYHEDED